MTATTRTLDHARPQVVRPTAPTTLATCPPLLITDGGLDEVAAALRTALA